MMTGGLNFADELQKKLNSRPGAMNAANGSAATNGAAPKPANGPKPATVNPPKPQVQSSSN